MEPCRVWAVVCKGEQWGLGDNLSDCHLLGEQDQGHPGLWHRGKEELGGSGSLGRVWGLGVWGGFENGFGSLGRVWGLGMVLVAWAGFGDGFGSLEKVQRFGI